MRSYTAIVLAALVALGVAQDWPTHIGQRDYGNERLSTELCTTSADCQEGYYCGVPPDIFALVHLWEEDEGLRFFCIPVERDGQFCDPQFPDACAEGLECLVEQPPEDPKFLPEWQFYRCQNPSGSERMSDNSMPNPQERGRAELDRASAGPGSRDTGSNDTQEVIEEGADSMSSAASTGESRDDNDGPSEGGDRMSDSGEMGGADRMSGAEPTGESRDDNDGQSEGGDRMSDSGEMEGADRMSGAEPTGESRDDNDGPSEGGDRMSDSGAMGGADRMSGAEPTGESRADNDGPSEGADRMSASGQRFRFRR